MSAANVVTTVARQLGVPTNLALAMMRQESGGNPRAIGDNGSSFGLFQLHQGGELGAHPAAWAFNPWNNARTALGVLAHTPHNGLTLGQWAAAAQRPANPAAYAASIQRLLGSSGPAGASVAPSGGLGAPGAGGTSGGNRQALIAALTSFATAPPQGSQMGGGTLGFQMLDAARALQAPVSPRTGTLPGLSLGSSGGTPTAAVKAIQFAHSAIGTPYVWGGESTKGYDCSGLIQAAYKAAGVNIPRTTYDQIKVGKPVSWGGFRPGDLIFSNFEGGKSPTHVVMYVGNGRVIAAPHTGTTVQYENVNVFKQYFVGARRIV